MLEFAHINGLPIDFVLNFTREDLAMLDVHQLNVFLAAAETLNFTRAAQQLHMTQPSVSQHIQGLERHFDLPLFIRNGRYLELTDAGLALLPLAREAVTLSIQIDETMESLKGNIYGHLVVGCSTTPGKYILPHLLARFHNLYPLVTVTCRVSPQTHALRDLEEGQVHFALFSVNHDNIADIEAISFLCDPIVLIVPLDHPWATRGEIEPAQHAATLPPQTPIHDTGEISIWEVFGVKRRQAGARRAQHFHERPACLNHPGECRGDRPRHPGGPGGGIRLENDRRSFVQRQGCRGARARPGYLPGYLHRPKPAPPCHRHTEDFLEFFNWSGFGSTATARMKI